MDDDPDAGRRAGRCAEPHPGHPAMVKALARTHRWQGMRGDGRYASISEMAAERAMRLVFLLTLAATSAAGWLAATQ